MGKKMAAERAGARRELPAAAFTEGARERVEKALEVLASTWKGGVTALNLAGLPASMTGAPAPGRPVREAGLVYVPGADGGGPWNARIDRAAAGAVGRFPR